MSVQRAVKRAVKRAVVSGQIRPLVHWVLRLGTEAPQLQRAASERDRFFEENRKLREATTENRTIIGMLRSERDMEKERAVKLGQEVDRLQETCARLTITRAEVERRLHEASAFVPHSDYPSGLMEAFHQQKMEQGADMAEGHTQIAVKCLNCGLHFVVMTWHRDKHTSFFCPECGEVTQMVVGCREVPWEIFEQSCTGYRQNRK